jgi:hypothetical protein
MTALDRLKEAGAKQRGKGGAKKGQRNGQQNVSLHQHTPKWSRAEKRHKCSYCGVPLMFYDGVWAHV